MLWTAKAGGVIAWPALVGALVGGGVSLGTTLLVEHQRHRASSKTEERRRLAEGQLAARLVILELRDAERMLKVMLERTPFRWPPKPGFEFQTNTWSVHATQLAVVLSEAQWKATAAPYLSFRYSNLLVNLTAAAAEALLESTRSAIHELDSWISSTTK